VISHLFRLSASRTELKFPSSSVLVKQKLFADTAVLLSLICEVRVMFSLALRIMVFLHCNIQSFV